MFGGRRGFLFEQPGPRPIGPRSPESTQAETDEEEDPAPSPSTADGYSVAVSM